MFRGSVQISWHDWNRASGIKFRSESSRTFSASETESALLASNGRMNNGQTPIAGRVFLGKRWGSTRSLRAVHVIKDGNEQITGDRRIARQGKNDRKVSWQGIRGPRVGGAHHGPAQERHRRGVEESHICAGADCVARQRKSCRSVEEGGGEGRRDFSGARS